MLANADDHAVARRDAQLFGHFSIHFDRALFEEAASLGDARSQPELGQECRYTHRVTIRDGVERHAFLRHVIGQLAFAERALEELLRLIGGGRVLGHSDSRYPRSQSEILERLETWARGDLEEMISNRLGETGPGWIEIRPFCLTNRLSESEVKGGLDALPVAILGERYAVLQTRWEAFKESILKILGDFHAKEPTARGLLIDDLAKRLSIRMNEDLLGHALAELETAKAAGIEEGHYRLADFSVGKGLGEREQSLVDEIADAFKQGGLQPPGIEDVVQGDKDRQRMYRYLIDTGVLTSTHVANKPKTPANTIVFHADNIDDAKQRLTRHFAQEGRFDTPGAKNVLGISRKYLIPLLECLDATGFTKRNDNERVLIDK